MSRPTRSRRGSPRSFPDLPPLLSVLRGDFLCLPFGGQADGPPHGDPANAAWSLVAPDDALAAPHHGRRRLRRAHRENHHRPRRPARAVFRTPDFQPGRRLQLRHASRSSIYQPCRKVPGRITASPFRWASVFPGPFSNPADGETQALAQGARVHRSPRGETRRRRHHRSHPLSGARRKRRPRHDGQRARHAGATLRMVGGGARWLCLVFR